MSGSPDIPVIVPGPDAIPGYIGYPPGDPKNPYSGEGLWYYEPLILAELIVPPPAIYAVGPVQQATPASGAISLQAIHSVFGRGQDLNAYRNTIWYYPYPSLGYGYFPGGQIGLWDFYNKQPGDPAWTGDWDQGTPGDYNIACPLYRNQLVINCWGAGGAGGGGNGGDGGPGGDSVALNVVGHAGGGAQGGPGYRSVGASGAGGVGTGGNNQNVSGAGGVWYGGQAAAYGGNGAQGGGGGAGAPGAIGWQAGNPGGFPGGGGGGGTYDNGSGYWSKGGGGGGGGFAQSVYGPGALSAGANIAIRVGAGGAGQNGGGNGASGRVRIYWS